MRFRANKSYTLWLNDEVYDKAKEYGDIRNCPIATAVKQQLGYEDVSVSSTVTFWKEGKSSTRYQILGAVRKSGFIIEAVKNRWSIPFIIERISKARG